MLRTTGSQFEVMVDFMERNGDLNKPADGPSGRQSIIRKWEEFSRVLNIDITGASKPIDKWKKLVHTSPPAVAESPTPINSQSTNDVEVEIGEEWLRPGSSSPSTPLPTSGIDNIVIMSPAGSNVDAPPRRRVIRRPGRVSSRSARVPRASALDAVSQNFINSDNRWQDIATEILRLRERDLEQQAQWQTLFAKF